MQALVLGLVWAVAAGIFQAMGMGGASKPVGFVVALVLAPALFGRSKPGEQANGSADKSA